MKNLFEGKNNLPLTFKYMEVIRTKRIGVSRNEIVYYVKSKKYQTDFYVREKPGKFLTRLI